MIKEGDAVLLKSRAVNLISQGRAYERLQLKSLRGKVYKIEVSKGSTNRTCRFAYVIWKNGDKVQGIRGTYQSCYYRQVYPTYYLTTHNRPVGSWTK